MKKYEQLALELKAYLASDNGSDRALEVIDEKIREAFNEGQRSECEEWVNREKLYWDNLKKWLTQDDINRMQKTHRFVSTNDYGDDEECYKCNSDIDFFLREPHFCEYDLSKAD